MPKTPSPSEFVKDRNLEMFASKLSPNQLDRILTEFVDLMSLSVEKSLSFTLPSLPTDVLTQMIEETKLILSSEPTVLDLVGDVVIIGDIHGHLFDLLRILKSFSFPNDKTYLFLGDLVDRGEFSTEVMILIMSMKLTYPKNIHIIRGNHEFTSMASNNGFLKEIEEVYPCSPIFDAFMDMFSYLPIAAIVNKTTLCIHGGLSPVLTSLDQLREIKKPVHDTSDPVVCGAVWSDPSPTVDMFGHSPRGSGFLFGEKPTAMFLEHNELNCIVRGHQCVMDGVDANFGGKVITVFSASNYCGVTENKSSVLISYSNNQKIVRRFPSLRYVRRSEANFSSINIPKIRLLSESERKEMNRRRPMVQKALSFSERFTSGKEFYPRIAQSRSKRTIKVLAVQTLPVSSPLLCT